VGERVSIRIESIERQVIVQALSEQRGPASVAQTLYQETAESVVAREAAREQRRLFAEPAQAIVGRPTKRDRRQLERTRGDA